MSDNTQLNPGANGDRIVTEEILPSGSGIKIQAMKIHTGAHGVDGDAVTAANPLFTGTVVALGGGSYASQLGASVANAGLSPMPGVQMTSAPVGWSAFSAPAAATQATVTKAAGATGVKHVCTSISATIACGATAQTPINVYLRDGATGAGAILWAGSAAAPVNGVAVIGISDVSFVGSAATAMTLEFSAAGVTASVQAVTMTGYDIS